MSPQGTIVVKLDRKQSEGLRASLAALGGFSPHNNPSAAWAMRGPGVVVTTYRSGKCVVQGGGANDFATQFLDGATGPARSKQESLTGDLIGTDESGKGDYFGPLVVAAVLIEKGQDRVLDELGVRDSKAMTDKRAKELAAVIRRAYPHEVVTIGPARYNELYEDFRNLNKFLAWATAKAIASVVEKHPCRDVLCDKFGGEHLIRNALTKQGIEVNLTQRVRAESNPAVAAASVLARDVFLSSLARLSRESGSKLPKGAGAPVLAAARNIYRDGGIEALRPVAKLHFKTTLRITGELF